METKLKNDFRQSHNINKRILYMKKTLIQSLKEHKVKYFMMLPGIVLLICMYYLPMFGSLIAFKEIDYSLGIFGSPWVGFKNFEFLFKNSQSFIAVRNTLGYNIVFIVTGFSGNIALAIALNELRNKYAMKTYQVLIIMPYFISMVVVAYLAYAFLASTDGFLNKTFIKMGMEPIKWYLVKDHWPLILFLVNANSYEYAETYL